MTDSEVQAIQSFTCPACGGEAVWTPSKKALVCPYCGTNSPADLRVDGNLIEENDLVKTLREIQPDGRGWAAEKKSVRCQSCQAITVFDATRAAQNCDFCGSPALIAMDDLGSPVRPGSLLPFKVADSGVREEIRRWYGSHFWAPRKLGAKAMTDTLKGMYLPFWTFDAHVECPWTAEAGHYYYVKDSQGRQQRQVRWVSAAGHVPHFFDDVLVPASKGVHPKLLENVGPFPTTSELKPYDPGYLAGWVVERYQMDLVEAGADSRKRMTRVLEQMCASQIPGDTHRGLRIDPDFQNLTFKHVLLPVWLLNYQFHGKTYQVAVNGYTGKITGEHPISWLKVAIAVILGLILLAVFFSLANS